MCIFNYNDTLFAIYPGKKVCVFRTLYHCNTNKAPACHCVCVGV